MSTSEKLILVGIGLIIGALLTAKAISLDILPNRRPRATWITVVLFVLVGLLLIIIGLAKR